MAMRLFFSRRLLQVAGVLLLVAACAPATDSSVDAPGSSASPASTASTAIESGPVGPVGLIADFELSVDGQQRVYDVYVPASHWNEAVPSPVVVLLHGQRGSRSDIEGGSGRPAPHREWQTIADADNVLLLVPQGATGANGHAGWNDCRNDVVGNPGADDVAFIAAALDEMSSNYLVDTDRVFAVGTSNGGHMALRLAHESPIAFAGIAVIAAGMPVNSSCAIPSGPVSALFMWGTEDPLAPYQGGAMAGRRGEILSADASIQYWVDHNNTVTSPEVHAFADIDSSDNSTVERLLYTGGDNNSQVALFSVTGGGHTEPSINHQYSRVVRRLLGEQNHDIEMATEVWIFFTS